MYTHSIFIATISFIASINAQFNFNNDLKAKLSLSNPSQSLAALTGGDGKPCSCAVFMSGQFKKGSKDPPKGHPALIQEIDYNLPCTAAGSRQCINKCLETIVKHLPNAPEIICGTIDRDCHRERAYLFVQHCDGDSWKNSNLSAGREFCCKSGSPVSCLGASST